MAGLNDDFFPAGTTALHRMDARFKMFFLALLSVSNANAGIRGLLVLLSIQVLALSISRIRAGVFIGELRYFSVFLLFVFLARALSTPGEKVFQEGVLSAVFPFTESGLADGAVASFRLFLIAMLGLLFMETTPPSNVRAAVAWYLKPIPFVPEMRVATMLSLLVRFLPLIARQARETSDALKARGVENRKNPVYRIAKLAIPMLRRIFTSADDLVLAMEARGYNENRALRRLSSSKSDWAALALLIPVAFLSAVV
jgi:energy-coupling factor transporter transmembrane protein EcfT